MIEEKCSMIEVVGAACINVGQKASNNLLVQLNVKRVLMRLPCLITKVSELKITIKLLINK
jgi:hypothetical protein